MGMNAQERKRNITYMKKKSVELSEAARKARAEYQKEWAKNNPDKINKYRKNYWERKAQEAAGNA